LVKLLRRVLIWTLVIAMALGSGIFGASELGGEIATLTTRAADGDGDATTRVWVVDDAGRAWLRSGSGKSGWYERLEANPDVTLERAGVTTRYLAVPVKGDAALRDRIHALMREKYTWADQVVSLSRDGAGSVPIRLDPVEPAPAAAP
jgi:hypothetical protein